MSSAETKDDRFVDFLQENAEDKGMLADLRRGLGQPPGTVQSMYSYVERFNPKRYEMIRFYMIAALFALHPKSTQNGNMGNHLRMLAAGDEGATERRFVWLLRLHLDALEPRLRQQISILKANDIALNWHQLIKDLRNWDHSDRFVQRQWANGFWGSNQSESEADEGKEDQT